jgi:hypothetical protein
LFTNRRLKIKPRSVCEVLERSKKDRTPIKRVRRRAKQNWIASLMNKNVPPKKRGCMLATKNDFSKRSDVDRSNNYLKRPYEPKRYDRNSWNERFDASKRKLDDLKRNSSPGKRDDNKLMKALNLVEIPRILSKGLGLELPATLRRVHGRVFLTHPTVAKVPASRRRNLSEGPLKQH